MILNTETIRERIAEEELALAEAIYREAMIDYIVLYSDYQYTRDYIVQICGTKIYRYWTKERLKDWLINSTIAIAIYKDPVSIVESIERRVDEHKAKGDLENWLKKELKRKSIIRKKDSIWH